MATATLLPMARAVFTYPNGGPLVGGFVNTFVPGGSTLKLTWQDAAETIPNANPIVLDAVGSCLLYGSGSYNLVVTDALGNQVPAFCGLTQDFLSVLAANVQTLGFISTFASIAALRANAAGQPPVVFVQNYFVGGTLGGGAFWKNTTDTTSLDNGGTIIVDGAGNRWYREGASKSVGIEDFGAKCDGVTIDTSAWQQAINAVQGTLGKLTIPGLVTVVDAQLTITAPITIEGVGTGAGPGLLTTAGASIVLCKNTFTTGDVFYAQSLYPFVFRDFTIAGALGLAYTSACPRVSGAGIHIAGPVGHINGAGSIIENVGFVGMATGIRLERCNENTLTTQTTHLAWGIQALFADNGNTGVESSHGQILNNFFFGNLSGAQTSSMDLHCGYGSIRGNKCLGAQYGIRVIADQSVNIGSLMIAFNSFEEQNIQSVLVTTSTPMVASGQIINNQFSAINPTTLTGHIVVQPSLGGGASELYDFDISGNNFNTQNMAAAGAFISVNGVNITITNNRGRVLGGTAYGVVAQAGTDNTVQILDNEWSAAGGTLAGTTGYLIQGAPVVRDLATRAFTAALLPSTSTDGSQIYATNGHATNVGAGNFTVTSGGTGCIAWRMSGAWLTIQT